MRVVLADRAVMNGYTLGLATGLRANGVDVSLAGPARIRAYKVLPMYPRSEVPGKKGLKSLDALTGIAVGHAVFGLTRPDLLHFQWQSALDELYAVTAKRLYRIPIAYTAQNPVDRAAAPNPRPGGQARLIELADLVFATGPTMLGQLKDAYPRAAPKAHVLPIGNYDHMITRYGRVAARAALGLSTDEPVFTWIGQIRQRKGIEALLRAFADFRRAYGVGLLLLAGYETDPAYARQLRALAKPTEAYIRWYTANRAVPQRVLDLTICAATQVVLPFLDASHSASVVLAMTHGRCVVSTAVGEIPNTLLGRGVVVLPGEDGQLVQAMRIAAIDLDQCDSLGHAARAYAVTELAWPKIGAAVRGLYQAVVR